MLSRGLAFVLSLVLVCGALCGSAVAQSRTPANARIPDPPRNYEKIEHDGWAWAIPRGSAPPTSGLSEFIADRLAGMRRKLGRSGTIAPLLVRATDRAEFRRVTQEFGGGDPEIYVAALAFPTRGIVVFDDQRLRSQILQRGEILAHELAHVVLGEAGPHVPRWYHEGMEQWLAGERVEPEMPRLLRRLAAREVLYTFADIPGFPPESQRETSLYYAQAHLFIVDVNRRFGSEIHDPILDRLAAGESLERAFVAVTGVELDEVEGDWHARLASEDSWIAWLLAGGTLYQVLAVIAVVAFIRERRRRKRVLARMAALEEGVPVDPRSYGGEVPEAPLPTFPPPAERRDGGPRPPTGGTS